ncbi:MAG TPA: PAS-domain containing protein [Pseudolabrys sp.]|nr:PAS-domain containing protein [Pseudolabrys sp.]
MHNRLFAKQLAKATKPSGEVDLEMLGNLVTAAYEEADRDRRRTDRSIGLMVEELEKTHARLLEAFEVVPEGLVMFDAEDRYVLWNKRYRQIYGLSGDLIATGQRFEDTLRAGMKLGQYPEAVGREEEWVAERLADHRHPANTAEQHLPNDTWIRIEERRTADGGSIGVRIDITDLKRREAAERRNVEMLNAIIVAMADAVLVFDEHGKVVVSNPAAEHLFGERHAIGTVEWDRSYKRFMPDGVTQFSRSESPTNRSIAGEPIDNAEVILHAPNLAEPKHLIINGRPLRDADGRRKGAVVVYRDITKVRETERLLRQSQKMDAIGQLTGGIAHDFNNILTVITGTIEILADALEEKPNLATIAKLIAEAADRGADLTRCLLAFARKQPLQPRETDVNTLILDTTKLLRLSLGEQIEIESMFDDGAWRALVDQAQLSTALLNLAVNARDAMSDGGKLVFETSNEVIDDVAARTLGDIHPGSYVMIAVSDTGSGIPAHLRDKVFEPFFTTKGVGKGTGLGLSMVYGFIKQSGGHVKLYSEEGKGTTIKLYLPRAMLESEEAAVRERVTVPGGHETVLVVEDDALVRTYVLAQLKSLGYITLEAANAAEALAITEQGGSFDLLFTDVIMPGSMNGRELAGEVLQRRPDVKVLFTSGYSENALLQQGRLEPGVLLLPKPYRKASLAKLLREALEARAPLNAA